jgi:hypothetical protein
MEARTPVAQKKKSKTPTKPDPRPKKTDKQRWQPRPKKKRPGASSKPRGMKSGLTGKHPR